MSSVPLIKLWWTRCCREVDAEQKSSNVEEKQSHLSSVCSYSRVSHQLCASWFIFFFFPLFYDLPTNNLLRVALPFKLTPFFVQHDIISLLRGNFCFESKNDTVPEVKGYNFTPSCKQWEAILSRHHGQVRWGKDSFCCVNGKSKPNRPNGECVVHV